MFTQCFENVQCCKDHYLFEQDEVLRKKDGEEGLKAMQ